MSVTVDYRRYAGRAGEKPKYLSDSLNPWLGKWTVGQWGNTINIDYTNLPTGDAAGKLVINSDEDNRFRYITIKFYTYYEADVFFNRQCITDHYISFKYRFSVSEAVEHKVWITTSYATPWTHPALEHPAGLQNPTPVVWTDFFAPVSSFIYPMVMMAGLPRSTAMATRAFFITIYGWAFSGPTTLEISNFNIRRLP